MEAIRDLFDNFIFKTNSPKKRKKNESFQKQFLVVNYF